MRTTAVRRAAIAASVASLSLLVTACGGSDSGGNGDKAGDAAAKPAVKALTAAELEKVSLAQGDVEGHNVTEAGPGDSPEGAVTVDKQECLPVAQVFSSVKQDGAVANTKRQVISEPKGDGKGTSLEDLADMPEDAADEALAAAFDLTSTLVSLTSYDGKGAADHVTGVRESAAKCAGGFTATIGGTTQKVTALTTEKVQGGEEALAWTVMTEDEGKPAPFKLVVVRQAGTVATFFSFNLGATGGKAADFPLPTAIVDAQTAKLG